MKRFLSIIFSVIALSGAYAQAPSPANVGIVKNIPNVFKLLDSNNTWSTFGYVDPATGVFIPYTNGLIAPNDCIKWGPGLTDAGQACNSASGGGGGGQFTIYTSHSGLVNNVTTPTEAWTVMQQGFYGAGDLGDTFYQWNFNSYCGGTSGAPVTANGITCILPIGQDPTVAGRYLLTTNSGINVRTIGFADYTNSGFDNAPVIPTLMTALGNNRGYGGQTVFIPGTPGRPFTAYHFTQSFVLSANAEYKCSGITGSNTPGTELVFDAGIHGVVQEDGSVSSDGGYGEGIVEGCTVVSLGLGSGTTEQNSNTITGVSMVQDPGGIVPPSSWHVGDALIATPGSGGYYSPLTITAVFQPGAYVSAVAPGVLTLASGYTANPILYGHATASFIEISTYNFSDGDTIQVGNNTFTMQATLGSTPGDVLIGPDWPTSAANLIAAINGGPGSGTIYRTPPNTPNISAAIFNTMTLNMIVFTDLTLGTDGNSYPAVYTAIGNPAGQFPYDTFAFGTTGTANGFVLYQLPVSQKYTVLTTQGSPDITITAGPRRPVPGDAIWADFAPWDTRLISVTGTSFPYTAEMNYAFLNTGVQNATVTHDSSSPGQMWVMPFGLKRDTAAKSSGNFFQGWPIGLDMPCSAASPFNCTTSHDSYNMYESDMVGRHTGGDNTGASDSIGEEFADNYVTDYMEGGTVGSVYVNPNSNSYESGTALWGPLGNCWNDNFSLLAGGYVVQAGAACAYGAGLIPPTPGSNQLMVTNQAYDGNGGGPWMFNTPGGVSLAGGGWSGAEDGSPFCSLLNQTNFTYKNFMFGVTPNCGWGDSLSFSLQGAYYVMSFWVYGDYVLFPTNPTSGYYSPVFPNGLINPASFTIGSLPTCNSDIYGWEVSVSNGADTPTYASIVSAPGSTPQKTWCNGTNWTYQ
jgi:hypothetical protein